MDRWPVRWQSLTLVGVLAILMAVLAALLVVAVASLHSDKPVGPHWFTWFDSNCEHAAFSCAVVAGALVAPIPIVVAVVGLLSWRLGRIQRLYRRYAREQAPALVQTVVAGDKVVGRDALCAVLKLNLEDPKRRLPHVLVGGVGVGKTAVLVRMTRLLAMHGAIPVPVRLRDAQRPEDMDFADLARKRFLRTVDQRVYSEAEGDKMWRRLREQNRIVVLADGLEEALIRKQHQAIRDKSIRDAFADAKSSKLPLIVTSRPHPTLRSLDAALLQMEPLSEGAARRFIRGSRATTDPKVKLIVENGEVVEAPLYMQLAQRLDEHKLLTKLDTRKATRLALRIHLLDTWRDALVDGTLSSEAPYTTPERERALEDLGAIAVAGLVGDSLEVSFDQVEASDAGVKCPHDARYSAGVGARLGLVEAHRESVRFRHSIVQAYVGSRYLGGMTDKELELVRVPIDSKEGPGRELLMALVMACWREPSAGRRATVRDMLKQRARRGDAKGLDLLAAAAEIDGMIADRDTDWIATTVRREWPDASVETIAEAKLAVIARLGDLAQGEGRPTGQEHRRPCDRHGNGAAPSQPAPIDRDALEALRRIAISPSETYAARLAAAQYIGSSGKAAVRAFVREFRTTLAEARALYPTGDRSLDAERRLRFALHAWVLPMLVGSKDLPDGCQRTLRDLIAGWMDIVCEGVHPSIEEAWARGFKFEANRRPRHVDDEMRKFLAEEAERLLERSRYWFTRVTLFHAFTLWGLDGDESEAAAEGAAARKRRRAGRQARDRSRRIVNGWATDRSHRFVRETASLCQEALRTGQPARYIWIDETGVVSKLGASGRRPEDIPNSRLWISPAAGWKALEKPALKLVGRLILALNLAEGVDDRRREQRLDRLGRAPALPLCLTQRGGHEALHVDGSENGRGPRPGSTCVPGCSANLCPYSPPGQAPPRGELCEAFCRQQVNAVERDPRDVLRRDGVRAGELKKFWKTMEERARL